jgi:hypothetical protein
MAAELARHGVASRIIHRHVDPSPDRVQVMTDAEGSFAASYATSTTFLVRPDGYIGWAGSSWTDAGLTSFLNRIFKPAPKTRV